MDTSRNAVSQAIEHECERLKMMLLDKNQKYGNSFMCPIQIFSRIGAEEQVKVRIDDKIKRYMTSSHDDDEDTILDLAGYLILLLVLRRQYTPKE